MGFRELIAKSLRRLGAAMMQAGDRSRSLNSALEAACLNGSVANAKQMVQEQGANPDLGALIWAARLKSPDLALFLIKAGASPDGPRLALGLTPLMQAARCGALESLRALIDAGARLDLTIQDLGGALGVIDQYQPINAQTLHYTPLMWAAKNGQIEAARYLIQAGANLNLTDENENRALDIAVKNGHTEMAGFFTAIEERLSLEKESSLDIPKASRVSRL